MNKNLKWAMQYVLLAAIISYGLGCSINRGTGSYQIISDEQIDYVTDLMAAYPDGIRTIVNNYQEEWFWDTYIDTFRLREELEPTILGSLIFTFIGEDNVPQVSRRLDQPS